MSLSTGQLKVNFRPLYPETIAVLKELAEHHSETVWSCTFAQLELCMADKTHLLRLVAKPEWASTAEQADEDAQSETVEDEKSFICPNAGKLDKSVELEVEGQESTVSDPSVMVSRYLFIVRMTLNTKTIVPAILAANHGRPPRCPQL
jgi:hypothetical protein